MLTISRLFYVSRAARAFDGAAIREILQISRRNNRRLDITGCLLYSGRCFAQVLEGRDEDVQPLARRIAADPRHRDVKVVLERHAARREYGDWSMGFLHDTGLEAALEALLQGEAQAAEVADLVARMKPDTVMGALR